MYVCGGPPTHPQLSAAALSPCWCAVCMSIPPENGEHTARHLGKHADHAGSSHSSFIMDFIMANEQVFTYTVSFGSFYLFVLLAMRAAKSPTFNRDANSLSRLIYSCVREDLEYSKSADVGMSGADGKSAAPETFGQAAMRLGVCTVGIQVSYLLWGLMQERIMTKPYESGELFTSSKFLVFANRFLALFAAWAVMCLTGEPIARSARGAPLYRFSFSSVSNILSSVCQYEALKYVSFPTQVRRPKYSQSVAERCRACMHAQSSRAICGESSRPESRPSRHGEHCLAIGNGC